jgi:hypothetical protein
MTTVKSIAWPLMFTYAGPVFGKGFLAQVELCGRLLASPETDGVWLDGVNPGGFALGATTLVEANRELRAALTRVFIDFAESANTFADFKEALERFYRETDQETVTAWEEALKAVQEGVVPIPSGLSRKPPGWECFIKVTEKTVEQLTPDDNLPVVNVHQLAAAA